MKLLLFIFPMLFMGYSTPDLITAPTEATIIEAKNEVFLLDEHYFEINDLETLKNSEDVVFIEDYGAVLNGNFDLFDNDCLDGCEVYGINCSCGTVYFQWCPCPWFPPSPEAQAAGYCAGACNQQ